MTEGVYLGVDIGGTRTRAAILTPGGEVLSRAEGVTQAGAAPEVIVGEVAALVAGLGDRGAVLAAGVCAPGPLDAERGLALGTPTIGGFRDYPLRDRLVAALGLPVFLDHDGHSAAFAEWRHGAGRGARDMVFVTVSTGIGGGAVTDGHLQRGRKGMAAHVGHMTILPGGPRCSCGNQGCWEALASGPAFTAAARAEGFADGAAAFAAARTGDGRADRLVAAQARWLAIGLVNLIHIYSPEVVVLGGGVTGGFDLMQGMIENHVAARAMPAFRDVRIVKAELGDNAGMIGAAALAAEKMASAG